MDKRAGLNGRKTLGNKGHREQEEITKEGSGGWTLALRGRGQPEGPEGHVST